MNYIEQKPASPTKSELQMGYMKHLQQQHDRAILCAKKGWNLAGGHTGGPTRVITAGNYKR